MEDDILQVIEEEIADNPTLEEMKIVLLQRGFREGDVAEALKKAAPRFPEGRNRGVRRDVSRFTTKEVLDRVGYGFATHQFVNILFWQAAIIGGVGHLALFLVGLFNGLKSLLSTLISSFLQEYSKRTSLPKRLIAASGIVYGFSFFLMAVGYKIGSWVLFAVALIIGSFGVVSYGDLYNRLLREHLKKERMTLFLAHISQFGILITAASLLCSGWLMERFPTPGRVVSLFGLQFTIIGFILSFMITAVAFTLSGYVLSRISQRSQASSYPFRQFFVEYRTKVKVQTKRFLTNKVIVLLLSASVLSGVAQALGNSFYGIFIYDNFKDVMFGGFLNVAVIYAVAILVSVTGPWLTRGVHRSIGYAPMLVFGTLLVAMMPAVAAFNPTFYAVGAATALSVIGSAIVGVAQGLLARKLLREEERQLYFANLSMMIMVPFIVLLPAGSWLAQTSGLVVLFKLLVVVLIIFVVPLYLILVALANKQRL